MRLGIPEGLNTHANYASRPASSMPRFRTGLRLQTGMGGRPAPLAHMVNYLHMASGGGVAQEAQHVRAHGRADDTELAHFSKKELATLDAIRGGRSLNPDTGLPEYGWFGDILKGLVRAGGAIAGGAMFGSVGAAAGAGLTNKLTGGSWSDALKAAALSGVGSEVAGGLKTGNWDPTKAFGSGATSGAASEQAVQANVDRLGDLNTMQAALGQSPSTELPNALTSVPASGAPSFGAQLAAAAKSAPGLVSALGALSLPLNSGSTTPSTTAPGPSFSVRPMIRTPVPYTGDPLTYGQGTSGGEHQFYTQTNPPIVYGPSVPGGVDYSGEEGYASGGLAAPYHAMARHIAMNAKGGINGPGGGQDDSIPAKLSDGEYVIDADTVSALGDGSNREGVKKLDQFRKSVRAHKRSAPDSKIPPKAKPIHKYLKTRAA